MSKYILYTSYNSLVVKYSQISISCVLWLVPTSFIAETDTK